MKHSFTGNYRCKVNYDNKLEQLATK